MRTTHFTILISHPHSLDLFTSLIHKKGEFPFDNPNWRYLTSKLDWRTREHKHFFNSLSLNIFPWFFYSNINRELIEMWRWLTWTCLHAPLMHVLFRKAQNDGTRKETKWHCFPLDPILGTMDNFNDLKLKPCSFRPLALVNFRFSKFSLGKPLYDCLRNFAKK